MTSFLVCFKVKDGKLGWESRGNQEIYNQESNICIHFYHKGWVTSDLSRLQSDSESESCSVVSDSLWPHGPYSPWNFPGQNTGVVIIPVSRGSSQPRNRSGVSCIAGRFFTIWATRKGWLLGDFRRELSAAPDSQGNPSSTTLVQRGPSWSYFLICEMDSVRAMGLDETLPIKHPAMFHSMARVWASSRSWWWTGKPGPRAAVHGVAKNQTRLSDWSELNWTER